MNGILYFSATGNSLYIAKRMQCVLGGDIVYIPTYTGNGGEFDKLFLVSPVYSFGLPAHVYELLPRLTRAKELVAVLNYGGMLGGADAFLYRYAQQIGLRIQSVYTLKMPENYTLTFTVPRFYGKRVLKKADAAIDAVTAAVLRGEQRLPAKRKPKEKTYYKNKARWHKLARDFSVTDACVLCGKCAAVCPAGNITVAEGAVRFADKCVACLGCYHRCPQKAVVYKRRKKKDRYVCPKIDENEIGKDLIGARAARE